MKNAGHVSSIGLEAIAKLFRRQLQFYKTQKAFYEYVGISKAAFNAIMTGKGSISAKSLMAVRAYASRFTKPLVDKQPPIV